MTSWNACNPWRDSLVYVPIHEAAACVANQPRPLNDALAGHAATAQIEPWAQFGKKLDAYLLKSPNGWISLGVRYGAKSDQYLSPCVDQTKARALLIRHSNGRSGDQDIRSLSRA